jgi:dolichol-phosphate mannosyltransferase
MPAPVRAGSTVWRVTSVLVFTATYNEAGCIAEWVRRVRATLPDAHLLVLDDNSPDGTADILRRLAEEDPALAVVVRPGKLGLGSAHRHAMAYALEHGFDVLVTLDADLSHQPEQIPRLLAALTDSDFVIGTRFGEGSCDYSGHRLFVSSAGNRLARVLIPTGLTEYTTSMRAFRPCALEVLHSIDMIDEGYAFFMECVFYLHRAGLRLSEAPIDFVDRAHGTSKIPKSQVIKSVGSLARLTAIRLRHPVVSHAVSSVPE